MGPPLSCNGGMERITATASTRSFTDSIGQSLLLLGFGSTFITIIAAPIGYTLDGSDPAVVLRARQGPKIVISTMPCRTSLTFTAKPDL